MGADSPELPNGMYVTRAGSIRYLGSPRGGIKDTRKGAIQSCLHKAVKTRLRLVTGAATGVRSWA